MDTVDTLIAAAHVVPVEPRGVLDHHAVAIERLLHEVERAEPRCRDRVLDRLVGALSLMGDHRVGGVTHQYRSEERRVGKECRSRWSPYH